MRRHLLMAIILAAALALASLAAAAEPLSSWNEGQTKRAVVDFVQRVTTAGSADFVPVTERIAVFDNDGTLWAEKPMYVQLAFALDRVKALAPEHPEWQDQQPFKAALEGDLKTAAAGGEHALLELVMATHAGMTTDAFAQVVTDWLATAKHPRLILHHTDAKREYAYDRQSSVGRLDKALVEAKRQGWTIVDMKQDWKRIFP